MSSETFNGFTLFNPCIKYVHGKKQKNPITHLESWGYKNLVVVGEGIELPLS